MDNSDTINVLVVEPGRKPYAKEIGSDLDSLQKAVNADIIQSVYPYEEPVALICDDEGKMTGKELNRALRDEDGHIYDVVAGTFLIVGLGEEDFSSLSPDLMKQFSAGNVHEYGRPSDGDPRRGTQQVFCSRKAQQADCGKGTRQGLKAE